MPGACHISRVAESSRKNVRRNNVSPSFSRKPRLTRPQDRLGAMRPKKLATVSFCVRNLSRLPLSNVAGLWWNMWLPQEMRGANPWQMSFNLKAFLQWKLPACWQDPWHRLSQLHGLRAASVAQLTTLLVDVIACLQSSLRGFTSFSQVKSCLFRVFQGCNQLIIWAGHLSCLFEDNHPKVHPKVHREVLREGQLHRLLVSGFGCCFFLLVTLRKRCFRWGRAKRRPQSGTRAKDDPDYGPQQLLNPLLITSHNRHSQRALPTDMSLLPSGREKCLGRGFKGASCLSAA